MYVNTNTPNEFLGPESVIKATQTAIEKVIIASGVCPPLNIVAKECEEGGEINWNKLSKYIEFQVVKPEEGESIIKLSERFATMYVEFIDQVIDGTAPLTKLFVFPEDLSSDMFDNFKIFAERINMHMFRDDTEHYRIITLEAAFNEGFQTREEEITQKFQWITANSRIRTQKTALILGQFFNIISFYGSELSESTLSRIEETGGGLRGDIRRYKSLARLPFNIFQLINPLHFKTLNLVKHLNRDALRKRNTSFALSTDLTELNELMAKFRRGES